MQASVKLRSNVFPGNRLNLARVDLANSPLDLFRPSSFHTLLRLSAETLENPTGELGPIRFRETGCFEEELRYIA
jgi:hypothetical protein